MTETLSISHLDERDMRIVSDRMTAYWKRNEKPQTGDYIRFADGVELRIAYVWRDDEGWEGKAQTADGCGSYYLSDCGLSMSGGLDPGVLCEKLTPTYETKIGSAWIFKHDYHTAHNGVNFCVPFQVWSYDGPSSDAGYYPRDPKTGRRVYPEVAA